jgi:hypothetical protein
MLRATKPEVALQLAGLRLMEAAETGAPLVATACTRCDAAFLDAMSRDPALPRLEIANLIALVARAVRAG